MLDEVELRGALEGLTKEMPVSSIDVARSGLGFVVTILSPSFEGQDDSVRQAAVWKYLLHTLSASDQALVEFVFTLTPDEALTQRGE